MVNRFERAESWQKAEAQRAQINELWDFHLASKPLRPFSLRERDWLARKRFGGLPLTKPGEVKLADLYGRIPAWWKESRCPKEEAKKGNPKGGVWDECFSDNDIYQIALDTIGLNKKHVRLMIERAVLQRVSGADEQARLAAAILARRKTILLRRKKHVGQDISGLLRLSWALHSGMPPDQLPALVAQIRDHPNAVGPVAPRWDEDIPRIARLTIGLRDKEAWQLINEGVRGRVPAWERSHLAAAVWRRRKEMKRLDQP